ncbi:MAG: hypothetical protein WCD37_16390 [Chloroflexia bacterium]
MNRGDEFISLYNRLDSHLRSLAELDRTTSFMAVVDTLARGGNAVVRSYKDALREFGELRNAIVHDRVFPSRVIAEPLPEVLAQLQRVVEDIIRPERLIPRFQRNIKLFGRNDPLAEAIQYMHGNNFSQVVVFGAAGDAFELLTAEGISRWLGSKIQDDIISVREARIGDALEHEPDDTYAVMSRDKTLHDAQDLFAGALANKKPRIFAIVITQNGKRTETPLGIVTPWDLMV